ncbi:hypothetical protein R5R35_012277 [Gryllus longicercus]|uniref:CLIP domain-containing serine protease n=1 Tax=Gryllus longicercus TaxID=2509291 RepID=A0AAN9VH19_9ORTH
MSSSASAAAACSARRRRPGGGVWVQLALVVLVAGLARAQRPWLSAAPGPLAALRLGTRSEGDLCEAPDGRAGVCRVIRDCPAMLALLEGRPSQENIIVLNRARCGFQGSVPVVCCAGSQSTARPPTTRPGGGGGGGSPPVSDDVDSVARDVSNHPNLRMLPQEVCGPVGTDRITGGTVADIYAYPWIARLGYKSSTRPNNPVSYRCGGSLISSRYVLTAAHCVVMRKESPLRLTTVKLGEHTTDTPVDCKESGSCLPPPVDVEVEQIVVHPGYDATRQPPTMHHDLALLRLARPVDFAREEFVRPVCLPVGADNQRMRLDGEALVVAGWGTTETGEGSKALLNVFVPAVPIDRCRDAYRKLTQTTTIIPQQLCAGGEKGRDSCTGDSGGPLMREALVAGEAKTVQFGVVSFGPRSCGTAGVPGVYTRVGHYMQWILDTMRP